MMTPGLPVLGLGLGLGLLVGLAAPSSAHGGPSPVPATRLFPTLKSMEVVRMTDDMWFTDGCHNGCGDEVYAIVWVAYADIKSGVTVKKFKTETLGQTGVGKSTRFQAGRGSTDGGLATGDKHIHYPGMASVTTLAAFPLVLPAGATKGRVAVLATLWEEDGPDNAVGKLDTWFRRKVESLALTKPGTTTHTVTVHSGSAVGLNDMPIGWVQEGGNANAKVELRVFAHDAVPRGVQNITFDSATGAYKMGFELEAFPVVCGFDSDCDDGKFCNGMERCAPGAGADIRGCRSAASPACTRAGDVCSEAAETCAPIPVDADGDGFNSVHSGGNDCDDGNRDRYPGNPEVCEVGAQLDQDCDFATFGWRDADGDGAVSAACFNADKGVIIARGSDCDDSAKSVGPNSVTCGSDGVAQICNDGVWESSPCASGQKCVTQPGGTGICVEAPAPRRRRPRLLRGRG